MNKLFSSFDPSTSMSFSLNWISSLMGLIILPINFWFMPSRINIMINNIYMQLFKEFKMMLSNKSKGLTLIMNTLFMFILNNNIMGLMPYIFTSSKHMTFTLSQSLPLCILFMLFGWFNNTVYMLAKKHFWDASHKPQQPTVIIETISNIIRHSSLTVLLTANMIAGHLLMSLLGNNSISMNSYLLSIIMMIQILLMMFESAVSMIQAYVFSIFSTLYSSEV
nr:ATP synthase F0 subunit 6 [Chelurotropella siamensis]